MATPLLAGDILQVVHACYSPLHSQLGLNTIYYEVVSPGPSTYENLPSKLYTRAASAYRAWLATGANYVGVSVTRVSPLPRYGPNYFVSVTNGTAGNALPLQLTGLIRWSDSGLVGPPPLASHKGRSYVPFPAIGSMDAASQKFNPAGQAKLWAVAGVIGRSVVRADGTNLAMVQRRTKKAPVPTDPRVLAGYSRVANVAVPISIATQRRRGDFGKLNASFGGVL